MQTSNGRMEDRERKDNDVIAALREKARNQAAKIVQMQSVIDDNFKLCEDLPKRMKRMS